ncbi:hypothetical protein CQ010_06235 [Arthrobacter sp. MYb211]|uniref:SipW-dependent-type signal peptide-containing protein n=1 Tax=unclassified Arthrobacter TaxID=235627 RepID=UPI000CFC5453|nr:MULTISPECIES: SipW-dependent-type signal peptide-containing protein [unclassified Arthrobacter]PRA04515.1 hypothetical protein CQ019_09335 [Arthrobacter sp. MYb229]PRA12248.1 hypothetical protein CQ015_06930 [Arthrobacter sp. MYb221]PRB51572.1 hypothetical protein CQ013_07230 [Arthrobacter sp. MYb216]PRC08710.1 hypothetical protein CQ010_06235 [Arthrobacter sp. MYb211]
MPKPLKFALIAAVLLVLGLGAQGTVASWRAESSVDPGTLQTGSLQLLAGDGVNGMQHYQFSQLSSGNLVPGQFTQAPLVISNGGTSDLGYRLDGAVNAATSPTAADIALSEASQLRIHAGMPASACEAGQPLSGEQLYAGSLGDAAEFAAPRPLPAESAGGEETLCVRVSLPAGASQTAAGGKLELRLGFVGQQR